MDAGVQLANPTQLLIKEAMKKGHQPEDIHVLSIGSGMPIKDLKDMSLEDINKELYWPQQNSNDIDNLL